MRTYICVIVCGHMCVLECACEGAHVRVRVRTCVSGGGGRVCVLDCGYAARAHTCARAIVCTRVRLMVRMRVGV